MLDPGTASTVVVAATQEEALRAAGAARAGARVAILGAERAEPALLDALRAQGWQVLAGEALLPACGPVPEDVAIGVITSGTTGTPRVVAHTLTSLTTVRPGGPARRWVLPFSPGTYAWWQLVTLAAADPAQELVAIDREDLDRWWEVAGAARATAISSTPTFWRRTLLAAEEPALRALPLAQVTLGGEPVDQPILDRLRALFPAARLTHIYASSEAGACVAVHDGREGFPAAWLHAARPSGLALRLRGERLEVRSPHAAPALRERWIDTGDVVERRDDRIVVRGRAGSAGIVNVGGTKVATATVEAALRAHPAVAWARAYGRRAPLVGEIVAGEVAPVHGAQVTEPELIAFCAARLPEAAVPRRLRIVDAVPIAASLKEAAA